MERRLLTQFGRRIFLRSVLLFCAEMGCLALAIFGEMFFGRAVALVGFMGFLLFSMGMFCYWRFACKYCRCPNCGVWLHSDPPRENDQILRFPCSTCHIEWDTQGVADL